MSDLHNFHCKTYNNLEFDCEVFEMNTNLFDFSHSKNCNCAEKDYGKRCEDRCDEYRRRTVRVFKLTTAKKLWLVTGHNVHDVVMGEDYDSSSASRINRAARAYMEEERESAESLLLNAAASLVQRAWRRHRAIRESLVGR